MGFIESAVRQYDVYAEPFGGNFRTGISVINSGYVGEVHYNSLEKTYSDFWRLLHENTDKLIKEIEFLKNQMQNRETFEDECKLINKKLNERKSIQRAAAQYISLYGNKEKTDDHIYSLKYQTYSVKWHSKDPIEFIEEYNSPQVILILRPNVGMDIFSENFINMLRDIKCAWILQYFYSNKLIETYKQFNIKYEYNEHTPGIKLEPLITNFV